MGEEKLGHTFSSEENEGTKDKTTGDSIRHREQQGSEMGSMKVSKMYEQKYTLDHLLYKVV